MGTGRGARFEGSPGTAVGREEIGPACFSSHLDGRFSARDFLVFRARGADSSCSFTWD